jgi:hypothetical protein
MILLLLACAPDLRDLDGDGVPDVALGDSAEPDEDTGDAGADDSASPDTEDTAPATTFVPTVTVTDAGDGVFEVVVNAREGVSHVDLGDATAFQPAQVAEAGPWELGFERYFFSVNGGTSGPGGVEAARVEGVTFDALLAPPADGWTTDSDDGSALEDWYVYDSVNHVLYAAEVVYALRAPDGATWKVQFLSYYDEVGNTGFPSFRVARL